MSVKVEVSDYVKAVAAGLCDYPDELEVKITNDERGVLILLYARREDLGRLIGKKGDTVNAMRSLLRALGTKNDARYSLKVDDSDKLERRTVMTIE